MPVDLPVIAVVVSTFFQSTPGGGGCSEYTTLPFSSCQPTARLPGESVDFARTVGLASLAAGEFGTAYVFGRKIIFCPDAPSAAPLAPCVQ